MALNNSLYEFNAQTISTTEYSLTNNSTTIATLATDAIISVWIDCANMVAGDEFEIVLREQATASSTQRSIVLASLVGAQPPMFVTSAFQVGHGWDVTMRRIAGTDRAFSWSIRAVT